MKVKIGYFKCFNYLPRITEFEGDTQEFDYLLRQTEVMKKRKIQLEGD